MGISERNAATVERAGRFRSTGLGASVGIRPRGR